MPFPYEDIRTFIDECEEEGMVIKVKKEVDWNLEAGAIARRLAETGRGRPIADGGSPAVLFEKIKGYPNGFRLASQMCASKDRIAKALGHKGKDMKAAMDRLQQIVLDGMRNPIKPILVDKKNAPCKQNIMMGDDINLYKFPAPMIHDGDGGRYMHTWGFVVTKDPDSDWVNWGTYRSMIADRRTLTGIMEFQQDIGKHRRKYMEKDEPMPAAIVIGPDPVSFTIGSSSILPGQSEGDVAGGIRGKPVNLVMCETIDLAVPANAEIVIEGMVPPRKRIWEGPYGEYTGYRASPRDLRPIYEVTAITYRDNPILTFDPTGTPSADFASSFGDSAMSAEALRRVGINARVWLMPESAHTLCVIAVKNMMPNIATMIKNTLTSQQGLMAMWTFKFLVVNDDVDIYDPAEVLWALSTRVHPRRGIIVSDEICGPLTPYASLEERLKRNAPHLTFDGTWPLDWHPTIAVPPVASFRSIYPREIQDKVLDNWKEYGL